MPIYEYVCDQCHAEFEELVRSDRDKVGCPHCGGTCVSRKLSVFAARQGGRPQNMCPAASACGGCCDPSGSCPAQY